MSLTDEFLNVDTPENVFFDYEVVGIGTRFIASIIDTILLIIELIIVNLVVTLAIRPTVIEEGGQNWIVALLGIVSFLIFWGYYIFFEMRWNGQSPGKRWTGIRVIRSDGTPVTLIESMIRNLVRVIDFLPLGYGLGIITMFINQHSCRLGDIAAGTRVVMEQEKVTLSSLRVRRPTTPLTAKEPDISIDLPIERLSADDIQLVSDFLQRRYNLSNQYELASQILSSLMEKMEVDDQAAGGRDAIQTLSRIQRAAQAR